MESKNNFPSVAVVILNWNGRNYLEKFLPSVKKTIYPNLEIIVADNNSKDDSINFLTTTYPEIRRISLEKNYGFAEGYNRALEEVTADYFVLLNSDVEVTPQWIKPVIELMESDKLIACCQPKMLSLKNREYFEYAGASGGWIDKYGYPFCRGRVFDVCEKDTGQYDQPAQIFWASGAALFVRSELYHALDGLDNHFFAHQEEIDLCWRMQNAGYKVFVQPSSVVYHLGGGSLEQGNKMKIFLNFRNNLIMLHKNLKGFERFRKILIRLFLDGLAGIQFLLKGKPTNMVTILKAHGAYYKWMGRHSRDKLSKKKMNNLAGVYSGSIVYAFFLRGKKTFSQIVSNKK